ncbi:hypothetical protein Fmac_021947 [Flemingia macrophylla]|uniref:Uncharacterized protein n=1 Tax=Flemingia macrophylla TaxID=520843 RepID=A0ABD1M035_9FABA
MEIYCLYGVGTPSERSHVNKLSPSNKYNTIPIQTDGSSDGEEESLLQNGVYSVDGDESVPIVSSGFMCTKGWGGRTQFNPSGIATYTREYQLKQPGTLVDRRSLESGASSNIMGNVALIEDVLLVAGGATGVDIGGDSILSDIKQMEAIKPRERSIEEQTPKRFYISAVNRKLAEKGCDHSDHSDQSGAVT